MLEGKIAIVTGASSGIGMEIATLFAAHGAIVILCARRREQLEIVAEAIRERGGKAAVVPGDVSVPETHSELIRYAETNFGRLDIAINNAGVVGAVKPMADLGLNDWREVLDTNLTAGFLGARAQIPAMLKTGSGSIVFVSSFVGTSVGLPGMAAYGAAKAALVGLVKGVTADYGAKNIRANALLPGGVDTPMAGDQSNKDWAAGLHALKRIAQPREIANAALFLASPMSSFVAGSALFADGGNSSVKCIFNCSHVQWRLIDLCLFAPPSCRTTEFWPYSPRTSPQLALRVGGSAGQGRTIPIAEFDSCKLATDYDCLVMSAYEGTPDEHAGKHLVSTAAGAIARSHTAAVDRKQTVNGRCNCPKGE